MKRSIGKTGSEMSSIAVAGSPGDEAFIFAFGAYGDTRLAVFARSLDDALEEAFEWLDDNEPGQLLWSHENAEECAAELGIPWPLPEDFDHSGDKGCELYEACTVDMTVCGHTTLKNGDCMPSWEWTARDATEDEVAELNGRFCAHCENALGSDPVAWPLCETCRCDMAHDVAGALKVERAGLDAEIPETDVRLQCSDGRFEWSLHTGDSSFDQDHRGHWGASSLAHDDDAEALSRLAFELIDQASDAYAEASRG